MASLFTFIKKSFGRRLARKQLERWKRNHTVIDGKKISHRYEMTDIYVDLYWYAVVNGMKREVMYQRHSYDSLPEQLSHDEENVLPRMVAAM